MRLCQMILIAASAALPACAAHEDMMSDRAEQFEQHASAYQAELDTHEHKVRTAVDLRAISALEQDHYERAASHMAAMQDEMQGAMSCMGSPDARATAATDDMAIMGDECLRHRDAMAAALDSDAARAEEFSHQQTMSIMLRRMRLHAEALLDSTTQMACMPEQG
jgi:hypothetical protein